MQQFLSKNKDVFFEYTLKHKKAKILINVSEIESITQLDADSVRIDLKSGNSHTIIYDYNILVNTVYPLRNS